MGKHERKSDEEIKRAWDAYQRAQAESKRRQDEVMAELERQVDDEQE